MKCYFELPWNRVPESHDDVEMRMPTYEFEGEIVAVYASALPLCVCCCKIISEGAKYARSQSAVQADSPAVSAKGELRLLVDARRSPKGE